jgi:uncharacterized membrane protein/sporulation protein YlmC with PRC-barrel domain
MITGGKMKYIPLDIQVNCSDGPAGKSVHIIVDPATRQVTYVVVEEKKHSKNKRLVPVNRIAETSSDSIQLNCTLAELVEMELFSVTNYRQVEIPRYGDVDYAMTPYPTSEIITIEQEEEFIPAGQRVVRRGTKVTATDGDVGQVDNLILDPTSGVITHFVLREGHLWGKKEVALPLSAIDRVEDDVVYLKLDKQAVQKLPAIPTRRTFGWPEAEIELLVVVFDGPDGAKKALDSLKQLKRDKAIVALRNTAVLVKDEQGRTSLSEKQDVDAKHGAIFGAVTGGLLGLAAGPVGAIVGAAAGAATGRVASKRIDMGFSNKYLQDILDKLQPGSSALVALVEQKWAGDVAKALSQYVGGQLFRQALPDEIVAELISNTTEHSEDSAAQ